MSVQPPSSHEQNSDSQDDNLSCEIKLHASDVQDHKAPALAGNTQDNSKLHTRKHVCGYSYDSWYSSEPGSIALASQQALLQKMISCWPRRGCNLLEIFCGSGIFLESFWNSGFDVTGQEQRRDLARNARARLGGRAGIVLNSPESLPFDDHSFDYVACINGLEFAENPQQVVDEAIRLASRGIILGFPNAWSLRGLLAKFKSKKVSNSRIEPEFGKINTISPLAIWRMLKSEGTTGRIRCGSVLLGPKASWKRNKVCMAINLFTLPVPLGGSVMLRIDFDNLYAGTPILLPVSSSKAENGANAALARHGFMKNGPD